MNETIKRQLDACRPGTADMLDAEMDALRNWLEESDENQLLAAAVERCDQAIRDAMFDVPVPVNLAARLKQAMRAEDAAAALAAKELAAEIADDGTLCNRGSAAWAALFDDEHPSADQTERVERPVSKAVQRIGFAAGLATALAGMVVLALIFSGVFDRTRPQVVSAEELGFQALQWDPNEDARPWSGDFAGLPTAYPRSDQLNVFPSQWKKMPNQYDEAAIVFDLTPPGSDQIFLYAIRPHDQFQVSSQFSQTPIYAAAGFCVGAYQADDLVYIVVVEGNKDRYRRVIKTAGEVVFAPSRLDSLRPAVASRG